MFTLPISRFDAREPLHAELAEAGRAAESIAATVAIPEGTAFVRARSARRTALRDERIAARIDAMVDDLLGPDPDRPVARGCRAYTCADVVAFLPKPGTIHAACEASPVSRHFWTSLRAFRPTIQNVDE